MASAIENAIRNAATRPLMALARRNRRKLTAPAGGHPYLTGMHQPMTEELSLEQLPVTGTIPPELNGRYLRIGPNPLSTVHEPSYHWFVGEGMAHGVRLKDGRADWYRNRWVRSNAVSDALGEPRKPGPRNPRTDIANTNIMTIAGRVFALVEAGANPVELNGDLDTVAHDPFGGSLNGSFSAHPRRDPATGEYHAVCYKGEVADTIWHKVVDAHGAVIREEPIAVQDGPSVHDCAITKNHVVVFDLPATFSMKHLLAGYQFPYGWNRKHAARVGLLPRDGAGEDIVWCAVDPCYVFHPVNAYELADGRVVVDVVAHDTMYAASPYGPGSKWSRLERWTIDPAAQSVVRDVLHDAHQEFPRMDERRTGRDYRYIYTTSLAPPRNGNLEMSGSQLFKYDLHQRTSHCRDFGEGHYPGEFAFVPRSPDRAEVENEDDGWLVGLVIDAGAGNGTGTSALHILNAAEFTGPPVATVQLPHLIPPGFHGNWVAD